MISKEELLAYARIGSYKPEILEKVYRLCETLSQIAALPYLKERLVLKGGTALNLFHFTEVPRLSVDIDLNYIGHVDREKMLEDRPKLNNTIEQILLSNGLDAYRNPGHHAGGKMVWRYDSVLGQKGNLEIDLNFMYRQTLFPVKQMRPALEKWADFEFPVLDIHELAAGKLSALLTRTAGRDLYDAHYLLMKTDLDDTKLRLAFVVYMAMTDIASDKLVVDRIQYDIKELHNRLLPVLRQKELPRARLALEAWAKNMVGELKSTLSRLLPLKSNEQEFIDIIRRHGQVDPSMITNDVTLQAIIQSHPAILWAVQRGGALIE